MILTRRGAGKFTLCFSLAVTVCRHFGIEIPPTPLFQRGEAEGGLR